MVDEEVWMMWKKVVSYILDTVLKFAGGAEKWHGKRNFEKPNTMQR